MFKLSKLFSFQKVLETFKRFPLAVFVSALGSGILIYQVTSENYGDNELMRVFIPLLLTFPLFVSSSLWGKYKNLTGILTAVFGVSYFFINKEVHDIQNIQRDVGLGLAFGTTVLFAPYLGKKENNGYWNYLKELILAVVLTAVSAGIIFASLSVAIESIKTLFEINISEKVFGVLFVLVNVFYSSVFFLSVLPKDFKALEKEKSYPVLVEKISKYLFVPILGIYFLILSAYVAKILLTQVWPNGWVAAPILIFSILGILTYATLWPFRAKYNKNFFYSVPVFLVIYFAAFYQRISQYGLTEMRYFGVLLGVYLLVVSLYFLFTKKEHLKFVPMLLSAMAFLSVVGPWSAFNVSMNNQFNRLEKVLTENSILVGGKIQQAEALDNEVEMQIVGSIDYFVGRGFERIMPWFPEEIQVQVLEDTNNMYNSRQVILEAIGADDSYSDLYASFYTEATQVFELEGYDYTFDFEGYYVFDKGGAFGDEFVLGEEAKLQYAFDNTNGIFSLSRDESEPLIFDLSQKLNELVEMNFGSSGLVPLENMTMTAENSSVRVKLYIQNISGKLDAQSGITFNGKVLVDLK